MCRAVIHHAKRPPRGYLLLIRRKESRKPEVQLTMLDPMPTQGSMPASGLNAHSPSTTQFTIFYNGNICVYEGIPAEKVREIMLIAGASAKSAEVKKGTPFTSFIPTDPSSPDGNSNNLPSQQSVCFPAQKNPICRLQEFPIARRQSLQRFLEKRRDRLGSKVPYASSTIKAADENNFCADNNAPNEGYQSTVAAS
ncbi:hypothetical protein TanjilG_07456 [Lupinus angustifolius]|uniref:Protein TIFY n=1 Tax=Lupinus angustifolius TaxID=3871 RepID=A0A4P1QUV9_LUPAN|nr:hypothetical protein TanjilG_07456 [Lupinus angustifolius]